LGTQPDAPPEPPPLDVDEDVEVDVDVDVELDAPPDPPPLDDEDVGSMHTPSERQTPEGQSAPTRQTPAAGVEEQA
jgi:hypothetical protein